MGCLEEELEFGVVEVENGLRNGVALITSNHFQFSLYTFDPRKQRMMEGVYF